MKNKLLVLGIIIQAALIGFKLFGSLNWSWWVILLPVIIPVVCILGFAIVLNFAINSND